RNDVFGFVPVEEVFIQSGPVGALFPQIVIEADNDERIGYHQVGFNPTDDRFYTWRSKIRIVGLDVGERLKKLWPKLTQIAKYATGLQQERVKRRMGDALMDGIDEH